MQSVKPVPGPKSRTAAVEVESRIIDLPERFAEHYREHHPAMYAQAPAGGVATLSEDGRVWLGTLLHGTVAASPDAVDPSTRRGLTADLVVLDEPYGAVDE